MKLKPSSVFCSVLQEMSRHGGEGKLDGRMTWVVHGTDLQDVIPKF